MVFMRHFIIAAISFLQLSCAPKLALELASFGQRQPTVSSWIDLPYQPLRLEEVNKVLIDEFSPVYSFPSGNSYVQGFALPATRPVEVIIKSYPIGNSIQDAYLFVPCVLLLDENFQAIHKLEQTDSLIERTPLFETPYVAFKNTFTFIIWPDHRVSYFVVYTTDEQLHKVSTFKMMTYSQIILPGYVGAVPVGKRMVEVPHAPVGRLKILIKDLN
jgi:hypothetical protein